MFPPHTRQIVMFMGVLAPRQAVAACVRATAEVAGSVNTGTARLGQCGADNPMCMRLDLCRAIARAAMGGADVSHPLEPGEIMAERPGFLSSLPA